MKLWHFSGKKLVFDSSRQYPGVHPYRMKPSGLWLSDETDLGWKQWCTNEDWNTSDLRHCSQFDCDTSRWLCIGNLEQILEFTSKYKKHGSYHNPIDWGRVKQDYSGIIITPYLWRARMNLHWYYGWDCASACVWDLSTVTMMGPMEPSSCEAAYE